MEDDPLLGEKLNAADEQFAETVKMVVGRIFAAIYIIGGAWVGVLLFIKLNMQ